MTDIRHLSTALGATDPDHETECAGCGEIFSSSDLYCGHCPKCWGNITRDEDE